MALNNTVLKALRKKKGYTQEKMSNLLEIGQSAYAKWEKGRTQPNLEQLVKIANILETTTDELLGGDIDCEMNYFMTITNVFPKRLKEMRLKRGMTQKELGEKVGVKQNTFTNWEKGKREPSFENLVKLVAILGTTSDYLLGITTNEGEIK